MCCVWFNVGSVEHSYCTLLYCEWYVDMWAVYNYMDIVKGNVALWELPGVCFCCKNQVNID